MAIALALIDIWAIHSRCLLLVEKTYKIRKTTKATRHKVRLFRLGMGILACQTSWKVRIFARLGISIKRKTKCKNIK